MSEARKCDRCSSYFEHDENMNNYIVFGNKHIIVDLKRGNAYDICPKCMMEFEDWFYPSETEEDNETTKKLCYFEYCNCCLSLIRKPPLPGETGYSEVRCSRWYTSIPMRGADPKLIDSITPEMFIKEEEYKDPCKSCHNGKCEQCDYGYCSEEEKKKRWLDNHKEEPKLSDPYEEGGL